MTAEQFDACAEAVARKLGDAGRGDARRWDTEIAALLVKQGTLSLFQAKSLLEGRWKLTLGQYEIIEWLGRGGMGEVFRARHVLMGRMVAIKVLRCRKSTPESEAAFQREIRMLARLDHENLVRALDAGYDGKAYYLVTELIPGLDLRRLIRPHSDSEPQPLDETAAASVISQAARGLAYAHRQGLVHRDIKPSNLIVSPDGRVKVLDLGLAGSVFEEESTRLGRVVGTMDYMAPEQIREPDGVGPQADIYALGCTLYFTLTGEVPFPGGTRREKAKRQLTEEPRPIRQLRPAVDPGLCRVVEAMMLKNPQERPQSAEAVIALLRPWIPSQPVPMPRREKRRSAAVADAAGSAAGASAASGSSADAGAIEPSQASQQITRGGMSEAEETWWSGSLPASQAWKPIPLRSVERAVGKAVLRLVLAAFVGVSVAALAGKVWAPGGHAATLSGWAAFGGVLLALVLMGRGERRRR